MRGGNTKKKGRKIIDSKSVAKLIEKAFDESKPNASIVCI